MINFTKKEIFELIKACLIISLAFSILYSNPLEKGISSSILFFFVISLVTAGLGFLFHELAHKIVAEKYGCKTAFMSDNTMLVLAVLMSFFGFIFAAPGAVMIFGNLSKVHYGKISAAGPFMNLVLGLFFLPAALLLTGMPGIIGKIGFGINSWLGLFNMIPAGNFDGAKIYKWSKKNYFMLAIMLLVLVIFSMVWI